MSNVTLPPGWRLVALDAIDSTNAELRRLSEAGGGGSPSGAGLEGLTVTAATQTAGRGRRGRVWASPRGNMSASILVEVGGARGNAGELSFVAGVALHEALAALAPGYDFRLKWPNDLLLGGRKLAGMLLETVFPTGAPAGQGAVIVGTGANLAAVPDLEPLYPVTALAAHGATVTPEALLTVYAEALAAWLSRWRSEGFAPVRAAWLRAAHGVGGPVTARLADGNEVSGIFEALDEAGALILRTPDGKTCRVLAGDVFFGPGGGTPGGGA
ncbi:biotin--[acetyl-CoA-carboxylase] ligase [Caenispirillum salinarum]|uniref:biotin--[acetyl-CoA-carboxylase] ligase n=1 Tax=Caenispirillum salinarum TaxID=859058 RepID=UPI00384E0B6D